MRSKREGGNKKTFTEVTSYILRHRTKMSSLLVDCRKRSIAVLVGSRGGTCLVLSCASITVSFSSLQIVEDS